MMKMNTRSAIAIAGRLFYLLILSCFASSCCCSASFNVKSTTATTTTTTTTVSSFFRRDVLNSFHYKQVVGHYDVSNQPSSLYPPLTNPLDNQPYPPPPAIVTVPPTNPVGADIGVTPNPPPPAAAAQAQGGAIPTANPTSPVTNPVTTPAGAGGGAQPVTNPVTTPTTTLPLTAPPTPTMIPNPYPTTNAPAAALPGQSWCVAKNGLTQTSLQTPLDYACGLGGADCSAIQQGGSCYNPNTLQNHASFAFNSYYQKNPVQTSCDFGGNAMVTNQNPSTGSCVYPTSSTSGTPSTMPTTTTPPSAMPTTTTPPSTMPTTTPSTMPTTTTPPSTMPTTVPAAGTDAPLNVLNSSTTNYPPLGGGTSTGGIIGASPPTDGSYVSLSNHLQSSLGSIPLVSSIAAIVLINPLR